MADEGKLRGQVARAARAKADRDSGLVGEFLAKAKETCHREWEQSEPHEKEARELIWMRLQALDDIERCYQHTVSTGKFAEAELLKMQQEKAG